MSKRVLWATCETTIHQVKIWKVPRIKGPRDGETDCLDIFLSAHLFEPGQERFFKETLIHEFIHVCEHQFSAELKRRRPAGCTNEAIVFGRELGMMMMTLKTVTDRGADGCPGKGQ